MSVTLRTASMLATLTCGFVGCSGTTSTETSGGTSGSSSGGSTGGGTSGGTNTGTGTTGGGDTWTSWASPDFFKLYCISCHVAGNDEADPPGSNLDWTIYSDVQMNANDIRCGVAVVQDPSWNCPSSIVAKQFPIGNGPKPSDVDRDRLVSWIAAGTPE
jgi:hypothetical protein